MADIWDGDDVEEVRVVDLRTPDAPMWAKAKIILERLVHDDEQSIERVQSSLKVKQDERAKQNKLYQERLEKDEPGIKEEYKKIDDSISKRIVRLNADLDFVKRDHAMSSAALERVNQQKLVQYKPKKTRRST